ncbi:hypothetical protein XM38_046170 [Halomicronema hongdechloris C2206]|uniref:Uncharacterized protein n=1 Tax=Halomicronema hongdechloris C2206 TaxID=1641165 RepID=A0A1Z3HTN2_9CYAN|nr:hypothetical protein XM38_046170 [Halomicronema hongdechloris C2206]
MLPIHSYWGGCITHGGSSYILGIEPVYYYPTAVNLFGRGDFSVQLEKYDNHLTLVARQG